MVEHIDKLYGLVLSQCEASRFFVHFNQCVEVFCRVLILDVDVGSFCDGPCK